MMLRPRQREFVTRCVTALKAHGNTLGVAPTGAGKTICLSGTAGEFLQYPDAKACILAHRDELTAQNLSKFGRVNPHVSTSVFDAHQKSWSGQATFAMVQTLARNLEQMPTLDMLVIDTLQYKFHPSHLSLEQSLGWIERFAPKRAVLTHMHTPLDYETVMRETPEHIEPAYDGMRLEFDVINEPGIVS